MMNSIIATLCRSRNIYPTLRSCCRIHRHHQQHLRLHLASTSKFSAVKFSTSAEEKVIPPPQKDDEPKQYSEQIKSIVDQIAGLTLLEVADLNQLLKERLNIQDAPVMAVGPAAVPAEQEEDEETEKPKEKTNFTVKLIKFDVTQKVKLIKEIKALNTGMNLVQAKKFVESVPQPVKIDLGKDEAAKLKEQLEAVGGGCEIE